MSPITRGTCWNWSGRTGNCNSVCVTFPPATTLSFYEQIQGESSRLVTALRNAASVVQARYGIALRPAQ